MSTESTPSGAMRVFRMFPVVGALVAGLVLGAAAFRALSGPPSSSDAPARVTTPAEDGLLVLTESAVRTAGITVAPAQIAELPTVLQVTGLVTADESRVAHVRPLTRGVVDAINVSLGSRVRAGQALLTYDNIELGQLVGDYLTERSSLRQARTDLEVKRTAQARGEALIRLEAIAQRELDLRRAEFRNAEAAVDSAEARVSRVEEQLHRFGLSDEDLRALQPDGSGVPPHRVASHSVLRAPFAGVITQLEVAAGEVVELDKDVFTLADLSTVWVMADVYEKDLAKVSRAAGVTIRVDAYPGRTYSGRITHVSDLIDPATRTAKVRCVVDNADGSLKLEMFSNVTLTGTDPQPALAVPADAVQSIDGQAVVFVALGPGRFERRTVRVGRHAAALVEILDGLREGESVVAEGAFYLKSTLLRDRIGDE